MFLKHVLQRTRGNSDYNWVYYNIRMMTNGDVNMLEVKRKFKKVDFNTIRKQLAKLD